MAEVCPDGTYRIPYPANAVPAYYDLFDDAQQLWNFGILSQRSARGSVYLGVRQVKGAGLESQILTASYSYAMSDKWISTFGTAYDLAEQQNRGQSLTITRAGADVLVHVGANFDESKDNAGIAISIEPRFGPFGGGYVHYLYTLMALLAVGLLWALLLLSGDPSMAVLALALAGSAVALRHGLEVPGAGRLALAFVLGFVMTRVLLTLVFYLVVVPIGLLMRLAGKDPLHRRRDPEAPTYALDETLRSILDVARQRL